MAESGLIPNKRAASILADRHFFRADALFGPAISAGDLRIIGSSLRTKEERRSIAAQAPAPEAAVSGRGPA